ncbi:MarR family winged helix-turn-helix transcriptional regulator [Kitasatospora sp. NBC_01287]|uniref:MarR family winged helix-turn-helix transcriptional regulator n=1 Tax=Kitasatospora sp. NBC_01287 TaxID=2903573 RepID=UPI00224D32E7|nr:MarR family winged helix-turn-helix transcriptional regulator [Kitasatospora sp. NBC_01287]MCX4747777.1 MarR family winged helix-turn-helix transcriptional regulator [Kitasatospora sp. NBC_01287]
MGDEKADESRQQVLETVERAMVQLRRSMTRRTLARLHERTDGPALDPALADVVDAVEEGPDRPGQEVTVGLVADRLGIDPSRASRLVSAAIKAGYLRRAASQADGRRIHLELTPAAEELLAITHRSRHELYSHLMRDWPERDRAGFAGLLTKFTDELTQLRKQQP